MKTNDQIIESIWKLAKKSFFFQFASGFILPLVLMFFPWRMSDKFSIETLLIFCLGFSIMFIVYGIIEVVEHRKGKITKRLKILSNGINEFSRYYYVREYRHHELDYLPEELKARKIMTKSFQDFHENENDSRACVIFGPVIFLVLGLGAFSFGNASWWLHVNTYFATVLLGVYIYGVARINKHFDRIWNGNFIFTTCKVNLHDSLPKYFGECKVEDTIMEIQYVMPRDADGKEFEKKLATDYIADVKKQEEERMLEATKNSIVVSLA